jgi:hypothetical protein
MHTPRQDLLRTLGIDQLLSFKTLVGWLIYVSTFIKGQSMAERTRPPTATLNVHQAFP